MEFDFNALVRSTRAFGRDYVIIRPGISLTFYSETPLKILAPAIADAVEAYLDFVPIGGLDTYYASNGTYKRLNPRILSRDLDHLRNIPNSAEFFEFHYGQGEEGEVGRYAIHFTGAFLQEEVFPLETNLLTLEWPHDLFDSVQVSDFISFIIKIANIVPFVSGNAGFALLHPQTFSKEAAKMIGQLMPRYIGFDPSYMPCRYVMKARSPSANWINLLNHNLVEELGGFDHIRNYLPPEVEIATLKNGILVRGAPLPPIGDVNRSAKDIGFLPDVARLLRTIRFDISGFGCAVDAKEWLARFDELESPGILDVDK